MPIRPSGVPADRGYSYLKIERLATRVRAKLELIPTAPINTMQLFDSPDITAKSRSGQEIPLQGGVIELEDSEGFTMYNSDRGIIEIIASVETYDLLEQDVPRGRFFVAHEIGHCLMHTDQLVRMAYMPLTQQASLHKCGQLDSHEIYRDTEWQANAFASAFLMPAWGLLALERKHSGLSPDIIAAHFRVSFEAAGYRLSLYLNRKQQLLQARRVERTRHSILLASSAHMKGHDNPQ